MDHTHVLTLHLEPPLLEFLEITPDISYRSCLAV